MRTALAAFISAASFCGFASAASAQTIPWNTGTPAYSYESQVPPQPAFNGSCDIISGNRVCSGAPAGYAPSGYATGYGPVGSIIAAPFDMAGTVVTAPFGAVGAGTPVYSYGSHVPPPRGAIGYCDKISGNMICMP